MKKSKIFRFIAQKLSGEISSSDLKKLDEAMQASSESRDSFEKLDTFCKQVKSIAPPHTPDQKKEWSELRQAIHSMPESIEDMKIAPAQKHRTSRSYPMKKIRFRYGPALALSCALLACLGFFIWKTFIYQSSFEEITIHNGRRAELTFTDGTRIRLNSGSTLRYPKSSADESRRFHLSGEAFFDVKKDGSPFIVITDNAKTTVLGTQFNVWARYEKTRVVVKQGSVRFERIHTEAEAVNLVTGKMSEIERDSPPAVPKSIDADQHLGWLEGRLVFEQTPLTEIIGELERHYSVRIGLKERGIGLNTLTGSFKNMPLDTVLSSISLTLKLQVEKKADRYTLDKK